MSYTNETLVRNHLASSQPVGPRITDQPLRLDTLEWNRFSTGPVEPTTLLVKSLRSITPVRRTITLTDGTAIISPNPLLPDSLVVASDSSLGLIYTPNLDYIADFPAARIERKAGGSLPLNATITVWSLEYTLCTDSVDYTLSAETGDLKRIESGSIANGEIVYLDYTPLYASHDEFLIAAAVSEANALIEAELDPAQTFIGNLVLQAAATYSALAIVARSSAARLLALRPDDERAALAWLKLADTYTDRTDLLLKKFRPPFSAPAPPTA